MRKTIYYILLVICMVAAIPYSILCLAARLYLWAFTALFGILTRPVRNAAQFPGWAEWICENILLMSGKTKQDGHNFKL